MDESSDILRQHLNEVPEPLRAVIKEHLSRNVLETGLRDVKASHGLTEDQREAVMRECVMVLCNVTPAEELKDSLIAEADLNYETAVRIQRAFESEVLLPISTEAEKRGYDEGKRGVQQASPAFPERDSTAGLLYDNPRANVRDVMQLGIQVFPGLIRTGAGAIPIRAVARVKAWEEPTAYGDIALNGGVVFIGLMIILTLSWWSLLGVGMGLLGAANVRGGLVKKYNVTIDFRDREAMLVVCEERQEACALRDALERAISIA